jgi:hypothetical protein
VATIVRAVLQLQESIALERGIKLESEIPEDLELITTDEKRLRQVLINLVGNALKFTERGAVSVRVRAHPGTRAVATIEVSDTGIGIPADQLEEIFEPFAQIDGSLSRRYGGTGLGLSITRSFCAAMGYEVEVQSVVGEGSTFRVCMPSQPYF